MELLVVLSILVLLAAAWPFAAPHLFPTQQLRNEAQRFVADVRIAKTKARTTGTAQVIELPDSGDGYSIGTIKHQAPKGVTLHVRDQQSKFATRHITLYPDGSSTGGIIDLVLRDRLLSIALGSVTGRAEILE
jgi:Tfp pilus assembly protein FimT